MTCPNCKTKLGCGCQQRKASNGAAVCTNCLMKYEAELKNAAHNPQHINITAVNAKLNK